MSVGAIDIINQAKVFSSIEEAVSDLSFIYATTGVVRAINKNYVLSRNLKQDIDGNYSIGIMFGRENCGLNNHEMTYANKILVIDTDKNFTSLNIAHAVSIVSYELFGAKSQKRGKKPIATLTFLMFSISIVYAFDLSMKHIIFDAEINWTYHDIARGLGEHC
jgi:TrmH family RNA methyltransferase